MQVILNVRDAGYSAKLDIYVWTRSWIILQLHNRSSLVCLILTVYEEKRKKKDHPELWFRS